jgi:hypothetical protein
MYKHAPQDVAQYVSCNTTEKKRYEITRTFRVISNCFFSNAPEDEPNVCKLQHEHERKDANLNKLRKGEVNSTIYNIYKHAPGRSAVCKLQHDRNETTNCFFSNAPEDEPMYASYNMKGNNKNKVRKVKKKEQ